MIALRCGTVAPTGDEDAEIVLVGHGVAAMMDAGERYIAIALAAETSCTSSSHKCVSAKNCVSLASFLFSRVLRATPSAVAYRIVALHRDERHGQRREKCTRQDQRATALGDKGSIIQAQ
jgi:hypothetical protein